MSEDVKHTADRDFHSFLELWESQQERVSGLLFRLARATSSQYFQLDGIDRDLLRHALVTSLTRDRSPAPDRKSEWEKYQAGRPRGDISREPAFNAGWDAAISRAESPSPMRKGEASPSTDRRQP
jgi:hypothetical protein